MLSGPQSKSQSAIEGKQFTVVANHSGGYSVHVVLCYIQYHVIWKKKENKENMEQEPRSETRGLLIICTLQIIRKKIDDQTTITAS